MSEIFIARQPIFDANLSVFAYELLFRQGQEAVTAEFVDGDSATSQVMMNSFIDIGFDHLVGPHTAFVNLTEHFLSNPDLIVVPSDKVVLEVLEDVEPTEAVINSLKELKQRGFTIALDDFIYDDKYIPMLECADIIKVDISQQSESEIRKSLAIYAKYNVSLLAERVETHEEFELFKQLNFKYFQGYFFSRPILVQGRSIPSNKLSLLQLVAKVNDPKVDITELSEIISNDISLSHKVLKYINSPSSGIQSTIDSIPQAVTLLGLSTIKNWVTVMALASNSDKPIELSVTALIRAKICQSLAKTNKLANPDSFFTVGLFSTLDAMMDQPLDAIMEELPLSDEAKLALLEHGGEYGEALKCSLAMETADFSLMDFMGLDFSEMSDLYLDSVKWADSLLRDAL